MPKSYDSTGRNNSRPFPAWVVIYETWWLPLADAQTGGQRDYKGVTGSNRVPHEATGSHGEPQWTTGLLRLFADMFPKTIWGSKMVSASRIRDLRLVRLAGIVFDFFYMCLFGRKVGLE